MNIILGATGQIGSAIVTNLGKKSTNLRLENSTGNVTLETVMRIFSALGAKLNLKLQV